SASTGPTDGRRSSGKDRRCWSPTSGRIAYAVRTSGGATKRIDCIRYSSAATSRIRSRSTRNFCQRREPTLSGELKPVCVRSNTQRSRPGPAWPVACSGASTSKPGLNLVFSCRPSSRHRSACPCRSALGGAQIGAGRSVDQLSDNRLALGDLGSPSVDGRDHLLVECPDQQRRQAFRARSARVAGLALLEGPAPRWLTITDLVISLRLGHVVPSISWASDACGYQYNSATICADLASQRRTAEFRCRSAAGSPKRTRFPLSPGSAGLHSRN